jgi:hypothetical protein
MDDYQIGRDVLAKKQANERYLGKIESISPSEIKVKCYNGMEIIVKDPSSINLYFFVGQYVGFINNSLFEDGVITEIDWDRKQIRIQNASGRDFIKSFTESFPIVQRFGDNNYIKLADDTSKFVFKLKNPPYRDFVYVFDDHTSFVPPPFKPAAINEARAAGGGGRAIPEVKAAGGGAAVYGAAATAAVAVAEVKKTNDEIVRMIGDLFAQSRKEIVSTSSSHSFTVSLQKSEQANPILLKIMLYLEDHDYDARRHNSGFDYYLFTKGKFFQRRADMDKEVQTQRDIFKETKNAHGQAVCPDITAIAYADNPTSLRILRDLVPIVRDSEQWSYLVDRLTRFLTTNNNLNIAFVLMPFIDGFSIDIPDLLTPDFYNLYDAVIYMHLMLLYFSNTVQNDAKPGNFLFRKNDREAFYQVVLIDMGRAEKLTKETLEARRGRAVFNIYFHDDDFKESNKALLNQFFLENNLIAGLRVILRIIRTDSLFMPELYEAPLCSYFLYYLMNVSIPRLEWTANTWTREITIDKLASNPNVSDALRRIIQYRKTNETAYQLIIGKVSEASNALFQSCSSQPRADGKLCTISGGRKKKPKKLKTKKRKKKNNKTFPKGIRY